MSIDLAIGKIALGTGTVRVFEVMRALDPHDSNDDGESNGLDKGNFEN